MSQRAEAMAETERLRTVSVPKAVAAFLVAGLVVLTSIGVALAIALRQTATTEAIREARALTTLEATGVVGPFLSDDAILPGPAYLALDRQVRQHVLG